MITKLSAFAQYYSMAGAEAASIKLAESANAASMSRFIPKSRLGRLGALGAIGLGAYGLSNRKEETMMDKAQNYINNLDPAAVNAAMGLLANYSSPDVSTMGYSPDYSMGVDYSVPGQNGAYDEYPEMYNSTYEKTSGAISKAGIGALAGALGTLGLAGTGSIVNKGLGAITDSSGYIHRIADLADDIGPYGLLAGTAGGALSAGLSSRGEQLARSAAKSQELVKRVSAHH